MPLFRIFPQKLVGTKCAYCDKLHGIRYWMSPGDPYLRFNSKKCMNNYLREQYRNSQVRRRIIRSRPKITHKINRGEIKMLSDNTLSKASQISKYAQEYCSANCLGGTCKPKELLPFLVEKGVFNKVDSRNGRDLRQVLRDVDDAEMLSKLIPQVEVERKPKIRIWYFRAV